MLEMLRGLSARGETLQRLWSRPEHRQQEVNKQQHTSFKHTLGL